MADELGLRTLKNDARDERLLKEAYALSVELGAMDTQIDSEVRRINGDLAVDIEAFLDGNPDVKFGAEKGKDWAVEKSIALAFAKLAKLFKLGIKEIPLLGLALDLLGADKSASFRAAYLDSHVGGGFAQYEQKKQRLSQIFLELSDRASVPLRLNMDDACQHEACWKAR